MKTALICAIVAALLCAGACQAESPILRFDELREGTSEDTVATPDDFPEEYAYGSGTISDWSREYMNKRMPLPQGDESRQGRQPSAAAQERRTSGPIYARAVSPALHF